MVSDKIFIFSIFVGCFYHKGPALSRINWTGDKTFVIEGFSGINCIILESDFSNDNNLFHFYFK